MQISHRIALGGATMLGAAAALPAHAETLDLSITLPQMSVAEYHRPYVAVWLEKQGSPARTLAVWYDLGKRNNAGTKWLRDVRMWWRAAGRSTTMPADGVSGATQAPGPHKLSFTTGKGPMPALTAGEYTLVVEAAREVGGRETVRLPFTWNASGKATASAKGTSELGAVSLNIHR